MAQISTADFKTGITLELDDTLCTLVDFQHVKPGKGGAFVRTTLKNLRTGSVVERTFRSGERMGKAHIDKTEKQYLYHDGVDYVFMDTETFEQMTVSPQVLGDTTDYLIENMVATLMMYGDEIIGVELAASVDLAVEDTEPGFQGDRVSGARKPATLVTGKVIQVPLFVNPGDSIKVDTRTGEYLTRT